MQCTTCGFINPEGATICEQCGAPLIASAPTERKVIRLSSHRDEQAPEPIERPWEVRVPKRVRKTAGATGKIPKAKPSAEKPEVAADEKQEKAGKAIAGASIGGAAAETIAFKPIVANAAEAQTTPITQEDVPSQATIQEQKPVPTPRRATRDIKAHTAATRNASTRSTNGGVLARASKSGDGGNWKRNVLIIALVACLVAGIGYFVSAGTNKNTVSFVSNGGSSIAEEVIVDGGQLKQPTPPTRNGYTFDGWFYDAEFTSPVEFPIAITENLTLYAKWSPASATSGSTSASSSASTTANASSAASSNTSAGSGNSGSGASGGSDTGTSGGSDWSSDSSGSDESGDAGDSGSSGDSGGTSASTTADVSMLAKSGEQLVGTVRLTDGYVIPDSSTHAYSVDELRALGLNEAELCIARNEPYARVGYDFMNSGLQAFFDNTGWYTNLGNDENALPTGSAGYITAVNLRKLAEEDPSGAGRWLDLAES